MTNPEPEPIVDEQTAEPVLMPEATVDDTIKRSWDDTLWYRALPFRGRP